MPYHSFLDKCNKENKVIGNLENDLKIPETWYKLKLAATRKLTWISTSPNARITYGQLHKKIKNDKVWSRRYFSKRFEMEMEMYMSINIEAGMFNSLDDNFIENRLNFPQNQNQWIAIYWSSSSSSGTVLLFPFWKRKFYSVQEQSCVVEYIWWKHSIFCQLIMRTLW